MDDMSQIPLHTVATFCEHTAEMLEGVSDNAELIKRHRASLERLRRPCSIALDYRSRPASIKLLR
jgi:hypothetical protein